MSETAGTDTIVLTPTWAGDLDHFRLLRASLARSPLAALEHHVVVQTEDLPLFRKFAEEPNVVLRSTAEVLPPIVEKHRRRARHIGAHAGRHLTRISGSLRRTLGWPRWPSYTGWHTQQLCKLAVASERERATTIVLDSDVVVTPSAHINDFRTPGAVVCFAQWQPLSSLRGKVRKWVDNAAELTDTIPTSEAQNVNTYFDTPFVLDGEVLRAMLSYLEARSGLPWWQHLLNQPPRRWSEFGLYKQYLKTWSRQPVDWRAPEQMHYLFDTSNAAAVVKQVTHLFQRPDIHYITLHSQSSGKHDWGASDYTESLLEWINTL
ncbi:DUF6492 family protein [Marinimicrobium agarilyticum]|uniref:DUF6492 family protein n=1 Tax=Marinimicrobium agarilyticum TaxID=306546 RepID=UPI000402EE38|nr:DUF6492 family protein [Marinimicrobium agarilyticum]